jgi:hypothetical protein
MAKIYETPQDIERDQLNQKKRSALVSQSYGITAMVTSIPIMLWSFFSKRPTGAQNSQVRGFFANVKDVLKNGFTRGEIGAGLFLFGALESIAAYKRAKSADDALKALGPEEIVLPSGQSTALGCGCQNTCDCKPKRFAEGKPRGLLEHAVRQNDSSSAAGR